MNAALEDLKPYRKLWSACLLRSVGLPSPHGIIVTGAGAATDFAIQDFAKTRRISQFLLRHDTVLETPLSPRGGFIVGQAQLHHVLARFFAENRIVALYEPLHPSHNGYNISFLLDSDTEGIAEVIGPGFDASDLQRGDLSPHESFVIHMLRPSRLKIDVRLIQRVTGEEYRRSAAQRRRKLERKAAETQALFGVSAGPYESDRIPPGYEPIDPAVLRQAAANIAASGILHKFRSLTAVGYPLTIATSFVEGGERLIYWDISSPALKYEGMFSVPRAARIENT